MSNRNGTCDTDPQQSATEKMPKQRGRVHVVGYVQGNVRWGGGDVERAKLPKSPTIRAGVQGTALKSPAGCGQRPRGQEN